MSDETPSSGVKFRGIVRGRGASDPKIGTADTDISPLPRRDSEPTREDPPTIDLPMDENGPGEVDLNSSDWQTADTISMKMPGYDTLPEVDTSSKNDPNSNGFISAEIGGLTRLVGGKQLQILQEEFNDAVSRVYKLKELLQESRRETEDQKKRYDGRIDGLEGQIGELESQIRSAGVREETLETRNSTQADQLLEKDTRIQELGREVHTYKGKYREVQRVNNQSERKLKEQRDQITLLELEVSKFKVQYDKLAEIAEESPEVLRGLQDQLTEVASKKDELEPLVEEVETLRSFVAENNRSLEQLRSYFEQLREKLKEYEGIKPKFEAAQQQLSSLLPLENYGERFALFNQRVHQYIQEGDESILKEFLDEDFYSSALLKIAWNIFDTDPEKAEKLFVVNPENSEASLISCRIAIGKNQEEADKSLASLTEDSENISRVLQTYFSIFEEPSVRAYWLMATWKDSIGEDASGEYYRIVTTDDQLLEKVREKGGPSVEKALKDLSDQVYQLAVQEGEANPMGVLEKALIINPKNTAALWQTGMMKELFGHFETAREFYAKAEEIEPGKGKNALLNIDGILASYNQLIEEENFSAATQLYEKSPRAWFAWGQHCMNNLNFGEAGKYFGETLLRDPEHKGALEGIKQIDDTYNRITETQVKSDMKTKNFDRAREGIQGLIERNPEDYRWHYIAATIEKGAGNKEAAIEYCHESSRLAKEAGKTYIQPRTLLAELVYDSIDIEEVIEQ